MQAVFHTSQPNVQYPRYLSERETKAAARDIQPYTCCSNQTVHLTVLALILQAVDSVWLRNHRSLFKSSFQNEVGKNEYCWSTCKQFMTSQMPLRWAQVWIFVSVTFQNSWPNNKSTKPDPALNSRTFSKTDYSLAKWISENGSN